MRRWANWTHRRGTTWWSTQSPLERRESLEQLRALEAGMRIACTRVEHGPFGVDTPADLARAREMMA